jgi:hypothetical protein
MQLGEYFFFKRKEFPPFILMEKIASLQPQVPQQSVAYEEAYNQRTKV